MLAINEHEYRRILENKHSSNLDENQVLGNEWQNKTKNILIAKTFLFCISTFYILLKYATVYIAFV